MGVVYVRNIDVKDYNRLRDEVKWGALPEEQAQSGLSQSSYVIACKEENQVVGTARVLWDGGGTAYICDVMVSPDCQGRGIGSEMIL